jgi:hypothetical protein
VTGEREETYVFDDIRTTPYAPGESALNLLALSRNLPDMRGGHGGAGAQEDVVQATKSIRMSSRRSADLGGK